MREEELPADQAVDKSSETAPSTQSNRDHRNRRPTTLPRRPESHEIDEINKRGTRRYQRQRDTQVDKPREIEYYQYAGTEEAAPVKGKHPAYTH